MVVQPRIRRLTVSNFRGLTHTEWWPVEGMNIIIGGGDSGKSTLLHALSLLFSPTNAVQVLETDYYNRLLEPGFTIEATVSLPENIGLAAFQQALWPWEWDGENAVLPDNEREGALRDPVYIFQLVGTSDLELSWQIIQPNLEPVSLSTGLRRRVGIVRLANDDRNDRDLRLVSGSALDRLLSKGNLKSRISKEVSAADLSNAMTENEQRSLQALDKSMAAAGLPRFHQSHDRSEKRVPGRRQAGGIPFRHRGTCRDYEAKNVFPSPTSSEVHQYRPQSERA